jgi:histidinol-phosphate/aromatic aminotransferase/cobyric acid decarboxylase-like protein
MLIFDECFMPLTRTGITSAACDDRALHLRAFTKSFSVPGVRIGYMVSNDTGMLDKIRLHLPEWNVSGIAERTGTAAAKLASETDFLERSVRVIETERAYLSTELEKCGFKVYSSDTDYLLIKGRRDLYDILPRSGILIRRCSNLSGLDDSYFRIAVRNHNDNEELIRVIREI